jgi:DNA mismatch repair protein MutS
MEEPCFILKEYIKYHDENIKKYGENTVVLMQVGSFYEIYSVQNESLNLGADIYQLADILGIQVVRRNKSIPEITLENFLMSGWNMYATEKFQKILLNHNYTIVYVDQVSATPNPERKITNIISPGTMIENYNNNDNNYLLSVYLNSYPQQYNKYIYVIGLSAIDISTGENTVHKIISSLDDNTLWKDELFRLIHYYSPKECLFHSEIDLSKEEISNIFQLDNKSIHYNLYNNPDFKKPSYQNEYLKKIFDTGFLTPIEYLGFDECEMTLSYLYMIQFIHEHKLENLNHLPKPTLKSDMNKLILSNNTIYQLYLVPNKEHETEKYNSLLSILNKCNTPIGRRLCKNRLLYPIIDKNILRERYDMIEKFQKDKLYENITPFLKKILDIEKLHRRMGLSICSPYEFFSIHTSYHYLIKILKTTEEVLPEINEKYKTTILQLNNYMNHYQSVFLINELEKYSLTNMITNVFQKDIHPELDDIQKDINNGLSMIDLICEKLNKYIDPKRKGCIKQDNNEKYGYYLYVTENRAKTFQKSVKNLVNNNIKIGEINLDLNNVKFTKRGGTTHLEFKELLDITNKYSSDRLKIQGINKELFIKSTEEYFNLYKNLFIELVDLVGFIDLNCNLAKLSIDNVYCKPEIIDSPEDKSIFIGKDTRHPIVEKVQREIEYIPNDIELSENGILLYGTNACGKSTLMKSIGLTLIMAQAGFFVPCSSLKYSPYTQMFTRILNNDNIFKRQSSFAVEMGELRSILKRSDNKSLVLGDEVCSGTETTSALSIVSAALKTLSDIKCSFIFTSHLHQLMDINLVKKIDSLQVYHLKILYNKETEVLIYQRKLEKGSGPAIYGLEVCKSLNLGEEFISLARNVQMEISDINQTLLNEKHSNYNNELVMDKCQICKKNSEHTHHIKEQNTADSNNIIDHHHKNINHNLVQLCESCHHKVHNENLRIYGYIQSSEGIKLNYEYINMNQIINHKKKFSQKDLQTILNYKDDIDNKILKKSSLLKKLELIHHIQISGSTLNKVLNGKY